MLGVDPTAYQDEILRSLVVNRETAVRSCHSIGKSLIAAVAVLWFLLCHRPSKVITTAPTDRQVKGILWSEIRRLHSRAKGELGGSVLKTELNIEEDWFAWGFTAPEYDPDRFQGFHSLNTLVVVDEAAGVGAAIYEGIDSILTGENSRLLSIGNPTDESGDFGKAFKRSDVSKHKVSAFKTPNLTMYGITLEDIRNNTWEAKITGPLPRPYLTTPHWVRARWLKWGEDSPMWRSRVMADFPDQADDKLIPLSWLDAAVERFKYLNEVNGHGWKSKPGRLGLDVARYGPDSNVGSACFPQGVRYLRKARKQDTVETVGWVNRILGDDDSLICVAVDADGLGAGVYDMLKHQGETITLEMRGGMSPLDSGRFINRRSEWYWQLREALDPRNLDAIALPPDEELLAQLAAIKYRLSPKGHILVETKDEMRKRGLPSPDEADSVMYGMAQLEVDRPIAYASEGGEESNWFDFDGLGQGGDPFGSGGVGWDPD